MIAENEVPVVAPAWHLRPDNGAGLLYKFTHDESRFLHLTADETVAVALCDGIRPLAKIKSLLADVLDISLEVACQVWQQLSEKSEKAESFLVSLAAAGGQFTRPNTARLLAEVASQPHTHQRFHRLQVPLSLVLIPTFQCHTNCVYCYNERPALPSSEYLPTKRWMELLAEAGEFGLDLLAFSGGDPLAYPAIEELLEVAHRYRMYCVLPTKTLVTRQRAERLAALLVKSDAVQVSVDSFDPEIAAVMTRTPGYAAIARESIQNLLAAGIKLRTNTVVTPINFASVESLLRELHAMGVGRANVTNYGRSYYRHNAQLFLSQAQHDELQQTVQRLRTELDWPEVYCNSASRDFSEPGGKSNPEKWAARAHCSGGTSSMAILPNGDVVLCEQVPDTAPFVVGNVRHNSLLEVWNSDRVFEFVVPPREKFGTTACRDCEQFDSCHRVYGRCFRDALFNYGTIFAPNPNCPKAPPGIQMA